MSEESRHPPVDSGSFQSSRSPGQPSPEATPVDRPADPRNGPTLEVEGSEKSGELTRIDQILCAALALPTTERRGFLDQMCAGQPALRAHVEALLAVDSRLLDLIERPVFEHLGPGRDSSSHGLGPAARLGDYELKSRLGEGGSATVFLAERVDGIGPAKVAIKVLDAFGGEAFARRFAREWRVLGRLRHPNIAQLHEGGVTPKGFPYLVLELVEGLPIDEWCRRRELSVRRRLELFATVCGAVAFAHRSLIVHRDLKPGNILVTEDGVVKLLDFGVSKLLDDSDGQQTPQTATTFRMMTPAYASPEQLGYRPTTLASDVYSLGVVLFEMLTGQRPFRDSDAVKLMRAVLEDPPPTASRSVEGDGAAERRLRRILGGDLDAILRRALAKDPAARYPTPEHLSDDIRRYLENRPVKARAAGWGYRTARLLRRRWRESLIAASLLLFFGARDLHQRELLAEQTRLFKVRDFFLGVLGESDPRAPDRERTIRETLIFALDEMLGPFEDDPNLKVEILLVGANLLGAAEGSAGDEQLAETYLRQATDLVQPESRRGKTLQGLIAAGWAAIEKGRNPKRAVEQYRKALRLFSEGEPTAEDHIEALAGLGHLLSHEGEKDEARALFARALELSRTDARPSVRYKLMESLVRHEYQEGRLDQARSRALEAIALAENLPSDHRRETSRATSYNSLCAVEMGRGDADAAAEACRRAVAGYRQVFGDAHPFLVAALNTLAQAQKSAQRYGEAERTYAEALDVAEAAEESEGSEGLSEFRTLILRSNLASVQTRLGKSEEAFEILEEAYPRFAELAGETHITTLSAGTTLARIQLDRGAFEEAGGQARKNLSFIAEDHLAARNLRLSNFRILFWQSLVLGDEGGRSEALEALRHPPFEPPPSVRGTFRIVEAANHLADGLRSEAAVELEAARDLVTGDSDIHLVACLLGVLGASDSAGDSAGDDGGGLAAAESYCDPQGLAPVPRWLVYGTLAETARRDSDVARLQSAQAAIFP
ncbi:MAG: serine/threonine-protein kinase [Acidobacteriota bacterium]